MSYTAIYSRYRDVGPALGDCICHILPHTAHTGMWHLLWVTVYAIYCHIQHIQGCGACSGGLYMPYTAIYSTYRDVVPPLGDCICHILRYTAHTGTWDLLCKCHTLDTIHCICHTLSTSHAQRYTHALCTSHAPGKGLPMPSVPPMHKEKVYPCPLYLPCTRKRSTHALCTSHAQGKGLPMPSVPPMHQEKVYPCPLYLPSPGKGLPMPSLPPMHQEKVYPRPLYLPCTRKRSTHALCTSHAPGKGLPMPSLPPMHQEKVYPCPLSLRCTRKRSTHALSTSHAPGKGLPTPSVPPMHQEKVYPRPLYLPCTR